MVTQLDLLIDSVTSCSASSLYLRVKGPVLSADPIFLLEASAFVDGVRPAFSFSFSILSIAHMLDADFQSVQFSQVMSFQGI